MKIVAKEETQEEKDRKQRVANKPSMDECLSLYDFEVSRQRFRIDDSEIDDIRCSR